MCFSVSVVGSRMIVISILTIIPNIAVYIVFLNRIAPPFNISSNYSYIIMSVGILRTTVMFELGLSKNECQSILCKLMPSDQRFC